MTKQELELEELSLDVLLKRLSLEEKRHDARLRESTEASARTYTFTGEVTTRSIQMAVAHIGSMVRQDGGTPIQVVLNTPGGSVFAGLALYDYLRLIQAQGTPVETVAVGMAASRGAVLLQAGGTRTITPNSYVLVHEVSSWADGTVSAMRDSVESSKRLHDQLINILAERATLSVDVIRERSERRDWWLSAPEALEVGLVAAVAA